jgi:hypothetical protein
MIVRQRITTYGISTAAVATVALALWLRPWATGSLVETQPAKPAANQRVDIVFAVDTTGSMGGLIEGAKRTVWSIATQVHAINPQADLRVGLVAYRDLGDDYVTKDFALTPDMDAVFTELSSYRAAGGGDTPEDVDAALYDAVHKMQWRDGAKKMIFLVGDAPPASRGDVPKFDESVRVAAAQQIMVNTIRCGTAPDTAEAWQQIAMLGKGEFSTIEQDGGVQQVATPYDDKLAEVSARIDSTAVIYGDDAVHARYEGEMAAAAAAPEPTKADRAAYYAEKPMAKGAGRSAEDIVGKFATGSIDVDGLDEGKLPSDMRGKSKDEIKLALKQRAEQREAAQAELKELSKKRADYLKDHAGPGAGAGSASFDAAVKTTVTHALE